MERKIKYSKELKLANIQEYLNGEGLTFLRWFTGYGMNDTEFIMLSVVTKSITLYAKWQMAI